MTLLSVNLNKIAVLRNARGGNAPSLLDAVSAVIAAGAGGITLHPRPDQRHVRPSDVLAVAGAIAGRVEYNLEGNPFAPPRDDYPGFLALVEAVRPNQATLVPDGDGQLTSDHGFNLRIDAERLRPVIARLKEAGARVSLFMDAGCEGLELARQIGADRIELYTGPYAAADSTGDRDAELARCRASVEAAVALGLAVNAGHDLSQANLGVFLEALPQVQEVSIGHALISEALYQGLTTTIARYLRIVAHASR